MSTPTTRMPAAERRSFQPGPVATALVVALVLFIVSGLITGGAFTPDQLLARGVNVLRLSALLGIIAAGQTLVILSGGEGIDLSVGAVVTLSGLIFFRIVSGQDAMVPGGIAAALLAGAGIGLINGLGITLLRVPPLVMTLGMAGVVQGLLLVITRGEMLGAASPTVSRFISQPVLFGVPGAVYIWIVFALLMWLLLDRTSYGRHIYAIGTNRTAASLSGVRVPWVVLGVYTLSGLLAACGGVMVISFTQTVFFTLGARYLFPSIAAVVVGGTTLAGGKGSYWGTMTGALVLTLLDGLLTTIRIPALIGQLGIVPETVRQIVLGVVLIVLISFYGRARSLRQ
jgi:ribose transport system permease protein